MADINSVLARSVGYISAQQIALDIEQGGGGGGGVSDYDLLSNKPKINGNILIGDVPLANIGVASSADLTNEINRAIQAETDFVKKEYALDQSATPSYNLLKSITIHEDTASTVIVNAWMRDMSGANSADISAQIPLPLVTGTTAGIMPSADHMQITTNASNIQSLQSQQAGQNKGTFDTYADLPTIVDEDTGDYATVRADETQGGATTRYYAENSAWWFDYIINNYSPIATQSITGLVQGSNTSGQIYVETNGTMSLVGYDDLVADISNLGQEISNKVDKTQKIANITLIGDITAESLADNLTGTTAHTLAAGNDPRFGTIPGNIYPNFESATADIYNGNTVYINHFSGIISAIGATSNTLSLVVGTQDIVKCGGWIRLGDGVKSAINAVRRSDNYTNTGSSEVRINESNGLELWSIANSNRSDDTNGEYDFWVEYTKI